MVLLKEWSTGGIYMKEYYVYRFMDDLGNVIYIGRTTNLRTRIQKHFSTGHLPDECYIATSYIESIKLKSQAEMNIYEMYYINIYKPKYNKQEKYDEVVTLELKELAWDICATLKAPTIEKTLEEQLEYLSEKVASLECENKRLSELNESFISQINTLVN